MPEEKAETTPDLEDPCMRSCVTTESAEAMLAVLKGMDIELVGRGPHRRPDGTYVAEVICSKAELEKISKSNCRLEIREARTIEKPEKELSGKNRYEKGDFPRGLGKKA